MNKSFLKNSNVSYLNFMDFNKAYMRKNNLKIRKKTYWQTVNFSRISRFEIAYFIDIQTFLVFFNTNETFINTTFKNFVYNSEFNNILNLITSFKKVF